MYRYFLIGILTYTSRVTYFKNNTSDSFKTVFGKLYVRQYGHVILITDVHNRFFRFIRLHYLRMILTHYIYYYGVLYVNIIVVYIYRYYIMYCMRQ